VRLPLLLVTFLLTALYATPAFATTIVTPDGKVAQPYQTWANQSAVPTPPGTVTVDLAPCPGGSAEVAGCAYAAQREIYLGAEGRFKDRFLHELGHIYDATVMNNPLRTQFETMTRRPRTLAWATTASANPPSEQFAEAYSMCARHRALREMAYGMYAYSPTPALHKRVCSIIRQAAA
jgi:hypothetical protein